MDWLFYVSPPKKRFCEFVSPPSSFPLFISCLSFVLLQKKQQKDFLLRWSAIKIQHHSCLEECWSWHYLARAKTERNVFW